MIILRRENICYKNAFYNARYFNVVDLLVIYPFYYLSFSKYTIY